jgi:hypothetical protein
MGKSSFEADLEQFVEFFSRPDNRQRLLEGTGDEVGTLIEHCPGGAAAVLAVGLRAKDRISSLAAAANVSDLAEQALDLLRRVEGRRELVEGCLDRAGKSPPTMPTLMVFVEPMFDIEDGQLMVHWVARIPDGRTHESVDSPLQLLPLFPALGDAVRTGWEGMKKLGWSMPEEQASEYAEVLKECADTVERLSSLLPSEVVKAAPEQSAEE